MYNYDVSRIMVLNFYTHQLHEKLCFIFYVCEVLAVVPELCWFDALCCDILSRTLQLVLTVSRISPPLTISRSPPHLIDDSNTF